MAGAREMPQKLGCVSNANRLCCSLPLRFSTLLTGLKQPYILQIILRLQKDCH